jgi:hypothetical protein
MLKLTVYLTSGLHYSYSITEDSVTSVEKMYEDYSKRPSYEIHDFTITIR